MRIALLLSLGVSWSREAAWRLSELGHEVHAIDFECEVKGTYLACREDLRTRAIAKLRPALAGIHIIPGKDISPFRYLRYAPRLRRICNNLRPDVLFSLWGGGFSLISLASGIRPYAVFLTGDDVISLSGLRKLISQRALNQAAVVFANGKFLGDLSRTFAPRARIHPICLGVDPAKFVPLPAASSPVVIICTRGFAPVYNNSYLIRALALLPNSLPDFRVVFPSAGDLLSETQELADKILSPELRRRVHFLNGVTDEDLLRNLQSAHIYTSVSRSDGTSISLLEALSCGLFPVLSDIPPNREWIDRKVGNGMLVPLDKPEEYARQLKEAILASAHRIAVSPFNRRLILERADSRKTMARVASLLGNTIRSRNCS